jgi:non-specific serine/threonine protein kinase
LAEEIAARQENALVFTQFREITDPLAAFLGGLFGRPGLVLHGGTAVGQRRRLVESFQRDDGPPFFLLTVKAGGAGLNLTQAAHVIHFDRWWNPAVENQATDRAFRIGQKQNVLVHKFVCRGTIEERIDRMIEEKQALSDGLLEGRTIARTFWGKAWCDNLESYMDYANRLPRGRTYVRNGSVVHLDIRPGEIEATVSGSELYRHG